MALNSYVSTVMTMIVIVLVINVNITCCYSMSVTGADATDSDWVIMHTVC